MIGTTADGTVQDALLDAADLESVATLLRHDGAILTGTVRAHPTEPDVYVVSDVFSGASNLVDAADVDEVLYG